MRSTSEISLEFLQTSDIQTDNKSCSTYCFNNGECTLCSIQGPLLATKCLRCRCSREWAGDRCERRTGLLPTPLKEKPQEIPIDIMVGLFITCIMLLVIFVIIKYKVKVNSWIKDKTSYLSNKFTTKDSTSFSYSTYLNDEGVVP
ncbi:unnamed protein product [Schistosoma turkestanicum]|nr:unnamed protein product [Schistosoma turkestanicum]